MIIDVSEEADQIVMDGAKHCFNASLNQIKGRQRWEPLATVRAACYMVCLKELMWTQQRVSDTFGRSRENTRHHADGHDDRMEVDEVYRQCYNQLVAYVRSPTKL